MIRVENLGIRAGAFELRNLSFEVGEGKYAALMGKTGCGKTSILEAICGLRPITAGRIEIAERDVTRLRPAERGIGYVPQDCALFTTMTVRQNLSFALRIRKWSKSEQNQRVTELADLLGISPLLDRKPHGLSGGERQRVALGRALSFRPRVLCLDEPLSALDEETRDEIYGVIETIRTHTDVTALHITHSHTDARRLGDVVLKLQDGQMFTLDSDTKSTPTSPPTPSPQSVTLKN